MLSERDELLEAIAGLLANEREATLQGVAELLRSDPPEQQTPSVPEGYIDAHAMARLLGRNVEVVRRNAPKIPGAVKIAGRWAFDPEALQQLKQEQPTARAPRHRPRRSDVPLLPVRP